MVMTNDSTSETANLKSKIKEQQNLINSLTENNKILKESFENLQAEFNHSSEKHEKDMEVKVTEISKVTHELTVLTSENEELKNDKMALQKLLKAKEQNSTTKHNISITRFTDQLPQTF